MAAKRTKDETWDFGRSIDRRSQHVVARLVSSLQDDGESLRIDYSGGVFPAVYVRMLRSGRSGIPGKCVRWALYEISHRRESEGIEAPDPAVRIFLNGRSFYPVSYESPLEKRVAAVVERDRYRLVDRKIQTGLATFVQEWMKGVESQQSRPGLRPGEICRPCANTTDTFYLPLATTKRKHFCRTCADQLETGLRRHGMKFWRRESGPEAEAFMDVLELMTS